MSALVRKVFAQLFSPATHLVTSCGAWSRSRTSFPLSAFDPLLCRTRDMDPSHPGDLLSFTITTTFNSFSTERRFPSDITVAELKRLLEGLTGASPASMQLHLFNKDGSSVGPLTSDSGSLASVGIQSAMSIQVTDPSIRVGEFEDLSRVKKFELSEEEYASRAESLRAFKERNKMGQFDEKKKQESAENATKKDAEEKAMLDTTEVGSRCMVTVVGQPRKKGTVMFKGATSFKPGFWIGVRYDEPLGKNDGSVEGKRYFECAPKYGAFVRPENVTVGDFPEDDLLDAEL